MAQKLPAIEELPALHEADQASVLDLLFEPSPAIHSTLVPVVRSGSYSSYQELIDKCRAVFFSLAAVSPLFSPDSVLSSIISSHPRLGSKKLDSAQSAAEQLHLQGEGRQLAELNQEYEDKFPGMRFVVFVNGRSRHEVMQDMRVRIDRGDLSREVEAALQAMCEIAGDRAIKLLTVKG